MKLLNEKTVRFARHAAPALILVSALASCGSPERLASAPVVPAANGPAADYPVVVGAPYKVGDKLYTPADTMNYDEVGYTAADTGAGVTGAHHTLPLPSYVEVTSLTNGRTVLVRLERRGPMDGDAVIALAPAALAQLGVSAGEPVRVRRVNPPEEERAALRAGRSAPPRMDTPMSLVAVLKRKLSGEGSVALLPKAAASLTALATVEVPPSVPAEQPPLVPAVAKPETPSPERTASAASSSLPPLAAQGDHSSKPAPVVGARHKPAVKAVASAATPAPAAGKNAYLVQAATMSTLERARKVAKVIGGTVNKAGRYFRVHTGPFATRDQAQASLAKVRAAGYSDARIFTNG